MPFTIAERMPAECTDNEIEAFCTLVKKGDEVDPVGLDDRVRRAWILAFGRVENALVGAAAIKRPNTGYRAGVFRKSQSKFEPLGFPVELGWVVVDEKFRRRGFGRRMIDGLLGALGQNAYTTSRTSNEAMHGLLSSYGFELCGSPWRSDRGPYDLVLHVKLK